MFERNGRAYYGKCSRYSTENEKKKRKSQVFQNYGSYSGPDRYCLGDDRMIFNIDFHSTDMVAVIMGFIVLYFGVVAVLTDN